MAENQHKFSTFTATVSIFLIVSALAIAMIPDWGMDNSASATLADMSELESKFGFRLAEDSEDRDTYIRSQMSLCYSREGVDGCYKQVARLLLAQYDLSEIMDAFGQNETYPEIFSRCHEVTHFLGRGEYEQTKSVPESYGQCTFSCWGGCYHGVLEQYFEEQDIPLINPSSEVLSSEIRTICGTPEDYREPRIYSECLHGIGHAMMYITESNLPQSLALCDVLADRSERETCYGGVFMENSSSSTNLDHPSQFISEDDPMYPCNALEVRYLGTCYQYQSSHFALIVHHDWSKVVELCDQVPQEYRSGCFQIMGSNQVGFTQDYTVMTGNCGLIAQNAYKESCIAGIISGLGGRYVGDATHMAGFCGQLDSAFKEVCYRNMGAALSGWSREEFYRENLCAELLAGEAVAWCKGE